MKKLTATIACVLSISLFATACSADGADSSTGVGTAAETSSKVPFAEREDGETWEVDSDDGTTKVQVTKHSIGIRIETETAFLTVKSVTEAESLDFTMPDEPVFPRDKAKFVLVTTEVENKGPGVWDLTCWSTGTSFQTQLQTSEGNFYLEEANPYRLPGNPMCNDSLGAGIPVEMTWYYEVPTGATPSEFVFVDPKYFEETINAPVNLVIIN